MRFVWRVLYETEHTLWFYLPHFTSHNIQLYWIVQRSLNSSDTPSLWACLFWCAIVELQLHMSYFVYLKLFIRNFGWYLIFLIVLRCVLLGCWFNATCALSLAFHFHIQYSYWKISLLDWYSSWKIIFLLLGVIGPCSDFLTKSPVVIYRKWGILISISFTVMNLWFVWKTQLCWIMHFFSIN